MSTYLTNTLYNSFTKEYAPGNRPSLVFSLLIDDELCYQSKKNLLIDLAKDGWVEADLALTTELYSHEESPNELLKYLEVSLGFKFDRQDMYSEENIEKMM